MTQFYSQAGPLGRCGLLCSTAIVGFQGFTHDAVAFSNDHHAVILLPTGCHPHTLINHKTQKGIKAVIVPVRVCHHLTSMINFFSSGGWALLVTASQQA